MGNYYNISTIYVRDYENVKVVVNPVDTDNLTLSFPGETFWKTDGTAVMDNITLNNHTGVVLLKNPP